MRISDGSADVCSSDLAAGFDVMSVANNHTMHGGYRAFLRTMELLRESGIAPVGGGDNILAAREPAIIERHGYKIGFLACTTGFLPGAMLAAGPRASCHCVGIPMPRMHPGRTGASNPTSALSSTATISVP